MKHRRKSVLIDSDDLLVPSCEGYQLATDDKCRESEVKKFHNLTLWEIVAGIGFVGLFDSLFYAASSEYPSSILSFFVSNICFYNIHNKNKGCFVWTICSLTYLLGVVSWVYANLSSVSSALKFFDAYGINSLQHSPSSLLRSTQEITPSFKLTFLLLHVLFLCVSILYLLWVLYNTTFQTSLKGHTNKNLQFQKVRYALRFTNKNKVVFWETFLLLLGVLFLSTIIHLSISDLFVGIPLLLLFLLGVLARLFLKPQSMLYPHPTNCLSKDWFDSPSHNCTYLKEKPTTLSDSYEFSSSYSLSPTNQKDNLDSKATCSRPSQNSVKFKNNSNPLAFHQYTVAVLFFSAAFLTVTVVCVRIFSQQAPEMLLKRWGFPLQEAKQNDSLLSYNQSESSDKQENNKETGKASTRFLSDTFYPTNKHSLFLTEISENSKKYQETESTPQLSRFFYKIRHLSPITVKENKQPPLPLAKTSGKSILWVLSFNAGVFALMSLFYSILITFWIARPDGFVKKLLLNRIVVQTHSFLVIPEKSRLPTADESVKKEASKSEKRKCSVIDRDNEETQYPEIVEENMSNCNVLTYKCLETFNDPEKTIEPTVSCDISHDLLQTQSNKAQIRCASPSESLSVSLRNSVVISINSEAEMFHDPTQFIEIEKDNHLITTEADGLSLLPTTDDFDMHSFYGPTLYPSSNSTKDIVELPPDITYIPKENGLEDVLKLSPSKNVDSFFIEMSKCSTTQSNLPKKFFPFTRGTYLLPQALIWTPRQQGNEV